MIAPTISVVVPVFNSEASVTELTLRLESVLREVAESYEVILVNDGSRDASWSTIEALASDHAWLRGMNLARNYGQHSALLAGIGEAQYEIIVTIDDDLQHPPEEIPLLLEKLNEGYDVVYGYPGEASHAFWRNQASKLTKIALQGSMGVETARKVSAFRAFRSDARAGFATYRGSFISLDVLLTWGASRFTAVDVRHDVRKHGESNYTFWMLLRHALNMLTGFSTLPLQLASITGFAFTVFGFFVLVYVVGRYLWVGGSVPGFPFLASIIAVFSGAQLFALGVIGEYLARMHFRLMGKPAFVVRERVDSEARESAAQGKSG